MRKVPEENRNAYLYIFFFLCWRRLQKQEFRRLVEQYKKSKVSVYQKITLTKKKENVLANYVRRTYIREKYIFVL